MVLNGGWFIIAIPILYLWKVFLGHSWEYMGNVDFPAMLEQPRPGPVRVLRVGEAAS